jgi:hypothetical protein
MKAAQHYNSARGLVLAQIFEGERPLDELMGGRQLPILDFPYEMEDCITSLYKAVTCINQLARDEPALRAFAESLREEKAALAGLRNQQEHMQTQIAAGQTGKGPILVLLSDDGESLEYRSLRVPARSLHTILGALYGTVANLFPNFDVI